MLMQATGGTQTGLDDLDSELADLDSRPEPIKVTAETVPDKYKGKPVEDIIQMHLNAEQQLSRTSQALAEQKRLTDAIIGLSPAAKTNTTPTQKQAAPITVEALLDNPKDVLESAQAPINHRVDNQEQRLAAMESQVNAQVFAAKYPNADKDLVDPAFKSWVESNSVRKDLVNAIMRTGDYRAADGLWSMWEERKGSASQATAEQTQQKRAASTTVRSGTQEISRASSGTIYSRAKIMDLKLRAANGDATAKAKLEDPEFDARLTRAYAEDRVR